MQILESHISTNSPTFKANHDRMQQLVTELRARLAAAREGGGAKYVQRHREQGKLPVRERIARPARSRRRRFSSSRRSPGYGVYEDETPGAGIVTGIGRVSGRDVVIVANDATVKGGTYYPVTVKKHLRAQQIALENRLPCVYLVDSGGAFLPLQAEVFPDREHFGRIFFNQARLSAERIAQIAAVMGSCTAGGAYVPAMSDETIIVKGTGTIFLGGPPLVKAATGEEVTAQDLGGAEVHTQMSGVADYLAENDDHAMKLLPDDRVDAEPQREPGAVRSRHARGSDVRSRRSSTASSTPTSARPYDVREVIARIVDGSQVRRVQGALRHDARHRLRAHSTDFWSASSPTTACCSRSRRSRPRTSSSSATSAGIPLVFLQNVTGFMVGRQYERGGIAKDGAKMVHAVANSVVPKFTVDHRRIVRRGQLRHERTRVRSAFSLDVAERTHFGDGRRDGRHGPEHREARADGARRQDARRGRRARHPQPIIDKYEAEGSPYYSTARLWDDGILDPVETRADAGARAGGGLQRADSAAEVRRLQDVDEQPSTHLRCGGEASVEHVTLNRPRGAQRLQRSTDRGDDRAGPRAPRQDRELRAVVISGAGPVVLRRRRPGVDGEDGRLHAARKTSATPRAAARMFAAIDTLPVPVIAQVHGAALGGGAGLAAVADIAVASTDATFGFTEVKLGLIPAVIAPYVLAKIGQSAARELFLTGRRFTRGRRRSRSASCMQSSGRSTWMRRCNKYLERDSRRRAARRLRAARR